MYTEHVYWRKDENKEKKGQRWPFQSDLFEGLDDDGEKDVDEDESAGHGKDEKHDRSCGWLGLKCFNKARLKFHERY